MFIVDAPSDYEQRRAGIVARAAGLDAEPSRIEYLPEEDATWAAVVADLHPLWDRWASPDLCVARDRLALPADVVPQIAQVNLALEPITGVRFAAVAGILSADAFFDALARSQFPSTQYIRWSGAPSYTPEPDIIHEVLGHGTMMATPQLAELHRLAGCAAQRLDTDEAVQRVADVFWFTVEFGVVRSMRRGRRWDACGAGLLSSPGELAWFHDHAEVRPIDVGVMTSTAYDINRYQPVLFGALSVDHLLEVVGGFFESVRD